VDNCRVSDKSLLSPNYRSLISLLSTRRREIPDEFRFKRKTCKHFNLIQPVLHSEYLVKHKKTKYQKHILIIVQRDATQSSLFIILQVHSTCFGCQTHPSSGVHETVNTASGIAQLPPSNVAKVAWARWREVAAQKL